MAVDPARLIARALHAFETERALIVDGRFEALETVIDGREAAIGRLAALDPAALRPHAEALAALRRAAERSAGLLDAARRGAAAGRRRVAEIEDATRGLVTYDARGAAVAASAAGGGGRRV